MARNQLWLDNVCNEDVGVTVGEFTLTAPVPRVNTIKVPGRNGDLHIYDGSYENRTGSCTAFVYHPDNVKAEMAKVQQWLLGGMGYRRLVTDEDQEHFLLARVTNGADVAARINKIAPFAIRFDCMPQRYLTAGETPIEIKNASVVKNPTSYDAAPLYEITGDGTVTIGVNGDSLTVSDLGVYIYPRTIYYDAETGNAYTPEDANANSRVATVGEMKLRGGDNAITITGSVESVKIVPRWWEL